MKGAKGSGNGRRTILYHGLTAGEITGEIRVPFFLAHDPDLATSYADEGDKPVLTFEDLSVAPLVLNSAEGFVQAWEASGAGEVEGDFHPGQTSVFAAWAKLKGYDSIVIPESAFEGERGYEMVAGTVGEPQTIVLDPAAVRLVE